MPSVRDEVQRQVASNKGSLPYHGSFRHHRERMTSLLVEDGQRELCVLGAGNCFDLDLEKLATVYRRIHLVDIDKAAVTRARARQPKPVRNKIALHAPVDLSGCNDALERWQRLEATPEELMAVPGRVTTELTKLLPGPFHTVVSACLLSQLLFTARGVLGERHPLFQAATLVLTLAHLRSLFALTEPEGRAWFVTDVTAREIATLPTAPDDADQLPLLDQLVKRGDVFHATAPATIASHLAEDPTLSCAAVWSPPTAAWLWHNGPERVFLVYAMRLAHRARGVRD